MAEDAILSELCAICHINPLKYKCPRCGIQTCSLSCVKRHKLWSQCSGVRNPAAYRKRHELATPASVDQDYNFISSVERSLQKADNDAADRGIDIADDARGKYNRVQARLNVEIAKSGAIVLKAPAGLSRSKQNRSHYDYKKGSLLWTIEWILPDRTVVRANSQAIKTIEEAFANSVGRRVLQSKRRLDIEDADAQSRGKGHEKIKRGNSELKANGATRPVAPQDDQVHKQTEPEISKEQETARDHTVDDTIPSSAFVNILSGFYFYLHCPNTPSNIKSLIPVKTDSRIADVLQDRLLLEFPTVFVRNESPAELTAPFIIEEEYVKKYGHQTAASLPSFDNADHSNHNHDQEASQVDEKKILEVLQKDLVS